MIPDQFVFNRGTLKEDARNPLMYYYIINAYENRFNEFDLKVWIDQGYIDAYKKECSRMEWGFLEGWKYAQDLLKTAQEIKINTEKYEAENKRLIEKYNEKIKKVDEEYRRIHGLMKRGKFKKIKDLFLIAKLQFRALRDEIMDQEKKMIERILLISYILIILIILIFAIIGVIDIIRWIRK